MSMTESTSVLNEAASTKGNRLIERSVGVLALVLVLIVDRDRHGDRFTVERHGKRFAVGNSLQNTTAIVSELAHGNIVHMRSVSRVRRDHNGTM